MQYSPYLPILFHTRLLYVLPSSAIKKRLPRLENPPSAPVKVLLAVCLTLLARRIAAVATGKTKRLRTLVSIAIKSSIMWESTSPLDIPANYGR